MIAGGYMENFKVLSAALLGAIVLISLSLKVMDYKIVFAWVVKRLTAMPRWLSISLLFMWMAVEALLSLLILWKGVISVGMVFYALAFFIISSVAVWVFFGRAGGCPCFGAASIGGVVDSLKVFSLLAMAIFLLHAIAILLEINVIFCLMLALFFTVMFFWGRHVILAMYAGKVVRYSIEGILRSYDVDSSRNVLLFFIKKGCPACVALMKYIERISKIFCNNVYFILIIDEFHIDEAAKLGEAIVMPDNEGLLKKACNIKMMPSLISLRDGGQKKYSGLNACNVGISDILCS
jgi:hypothetical protein